MTDLPDRTRTEWHVEATELDGTWVWVSSTSHTTEEAEQKRAAFLTRFPRADTRIVRITTTHTVEDDHDHCGGTHVRTVNGRIIICEPPTDSPTHPGQRSPDAQ